MVCAETRCLGLVILCRNTYLGLVILCRNALPWAGYIVPKHVTLGWLYCAETRYPRQQTLSSGNGDVLIEYNKYVI
jgi:hypothetical protein